MSMAMVQQRAMTMTMAPAVMTMEILVGIVMMSLGTRAVRGMDMAVRVAITIIMDMGTITAACTISNIS